MVFVQMIDDQVNEKSDLKIDVCGISFDKPLNRKQTCNIHYLSTLQAFKPK